MVGVGDVGTAETLNNVVELVLCFGVDGVLADRNGLSKSESGAHNRGRVIVQTLTTSREFGLVLGAGEMVLVGVLAVIRLLADIASTLEVGLVGLCVVGSAGL